MIELAEGWHAQGGLRLRVEVVAGIEVARRVAAGEAFDLVVLASDAIDRLAAAGHVAAASKANLARSGVAIAVREGARRPDIGSEAALRQAVLDARSIGYSTGPSGTALLALFARWNLCEALRPKLVQAPPGVPVGSLVAAGTAEIGFQQRSEMMHLPGITVLGGMPAGLEVVTTFCAARCNTSTRRGNVQALIDFLCAPATAAAKRRHGMAPADPDASSRA